jgi:hypothetical protein
MAVRSLIYEIKLDREEAYEQLSNEALQQLPLPKR